MRMKLKSRAGNAIRGPLVKTHRIGKRRPEKIVVADRHLSQNPRQAIPLHGVYLGPADAFIEMNVSIKVSSLDSTGEASAQGEQREKV